MKYVYVSVCFSHRLEFSLLFAGCLRFQGGSGPHLIQSNCSVWQPSEQNMHMTAFNLEKSVSFDSTVGIISHVHFRIRL